MPLDRDPEQVFGAPVDHADGPRGRSCVQRGRFLVLVLCLFALVPRRPCESARSHVDRGDLRCGGFR